LNENRTALSEDSEFLYRNRRIVEGYPGLGDLALDTYRAAIASRPEEALRLKTVLAYLDRLIDIRTARTFLVVGCGPQPDAIRVLRDMGYDVVGVEPVHQTLEAARRHLQDEGAVVEGCAEDLPNETESQDVVVLEAVLEHVDSVGKSLAEAYRVLVPGGVAYITTTNRHQLRDNEEFNVRLYQMLPKVVKESYVFRHLHHEPRLANYAERPAVHWFTYAELCEKGREAGFAQFYSHLDLKPPEISSFTGSQVTRRIKAQVLKHVHRSAWVRAAALTQVGGLIFMVKRH
jgi:ubiquinone/menaquinone biosynthesis C-methylase UbiE